MATILFVFVFSVLFFFFFFCSLYHKNTGRDVKGLNRHWELEMILIYLLVRLG